MKVSVSVPDEDIEFLDNYAKTHQVASRSAALQRAIRLLRATELGGAYASAFSDWADSPDGDAWDTTAADTGCAAAKYGSFPSTPRAEANRHENARGDRQQRRR